MPIDATTRFNLKNRFEKSWCPLPARNIIRCSRFVGLSARVVVAAGVRSGVESVSVIGRKGVLALNSVIGTARTGADVVKIVTVFDSSDTDGVGVEVEVGVLSRAERKEESAEICCSKIRWGFGGAA